MSDKSQSKREEQTSRGRRLRAKRNQADARGQSRPPLKTGPVPPSRNKTVMTDTPVIPPKKERARSQGGKVAKPSSRDGSVAADASRKETTDSPGNQKPVATNKVQKAFARPWVMSEKGISLIKSAFPMFDYATDTTKPLQPHEHPYSALERAMSEELAYIQARRLTAKGLIVDVGGNPSRHLSEGRSQIHCCCPEIEPADVMRNQRYGKQHNFCTNKVQDCGEEADVYLAIHSIYYLSPSEVLKLVHKAKNKALVATAHKFVDGYGRFHYNGSGYESSYQLISSDQVRMVVQGNDHGAYVHDPLFWLEQSHYECDGLAMTWGSRQYGDTFVYTFVPCPVGFTRTTRSKDLTAFESLKRSDHYGGVSLDTSNDLPAMQLLNLTNVQVRSLGPLFWTTKNTKQMFIPKGMVSAVAYKLVGKPRTRDTWQICIRESKKLLDRDILNVPESWRVQLAIHLPAIAFVIHLEDEISAFNSLITPAKAKAYAKLARALSLTPDVATCMDPLWRLLPWNCCRSRYRRNETLYQAGELVSDEYENSRTSEPVIHGLPTPGAVFEFASTTTTVALKNLRKGASVVAKKAEEVLDRTSVYQHTTTFSGSIPICSTANQINEIASLRNRVCMETPPAKAGEWERLTAKTYGKGWLDFDRMRDEIDFDEDRAFHKWNEAFPKGRRENQLLAWEKLKSEPLERTAFIRKTFVKREKLLKSSVDGYDVHTPRAIQGATDEANVTLGPFVAQYSKCVARQWDGSGRFYYTAGATGVDVGRWMADAYEPDSWIVEVDMTSYDGTQGEGPNNATGSYMTSAGMEDFGDASRVYDNCRNIVGYTRNGVKYTTDFGMCSGDSFTSSGNSVNTGTTTADIMDHVFCDGAGKMAVMGDDNTTIIRKEERDPNLTIAMATERIVARYKDFGFIAKVKIHTELAKAEFCSGVFWPAVVDGVETYVLGGKPGKQLPKIGYSITRQKPGAVKAMMLGNLSAYNHVPLLSDYCTSMLDKMRNVEATEYSDKEAKYKVLASNSNVHESEMIGCFFEERYGLDLAVVRESLAAVLSSATLDSTVRWEFIDILRGVDA